jgi:SAM-dependent methyltransferase
MSSATTHPIFARVWNAAGPRAVPHRDRRELLEGAAGAVVEIGVGTGLNFPFYPDTVTSVLAVEPEPFLRERATEAAAEAPELGVTVVDGTAAAIPAPDASFDVAVACLVLCSVPDQAAALAELRRVLRPGGELRFYEHVIAEPRAGAGLQRVLDATRIWPTLGAGCHLSRDTGAAIRAAGFTVERCRRLVSGPGPDGVGLPHLLGLARPAA